MAKYLTTGWIQTSTITGLGATARRCTHTDLHASIVTDGENLFDPSIGIYVNAAAMGVRGAADIARVDSTRWGDGFQIDAGLRIRGDSVEATSIRSIHSVVLPR